MNPQATTPSLRDNNSDGCVQGNDAGAEGREAEARPRGRALVDDLMPIRSDPETVKKNYVFLNSIYLTVEIPVGKLQGTRSQQYRSQISKPAIEYSSEDGSGSKNIY